MRTGFIFTVVFTLLFTLFLLLSIVYLRSIQMNESNLVDNRNISKISYVYDDIAYDLQNFLGVNITINKNSTVTTINITDTLPNSLTAPTTELTNYENFLTGIYSNKTNMLNSSYASLILLNTTRFADTPYIFFLNSNSSLSFFYNYNNLSKNQLIINGSKKISNFSIQVSLGDQCFNSNCSNATYSSWPWGVGDLFVTLNITDSSLTTITVNGSTSGFVNASANNTFWVNLTSNNLINLTVGAYSENYSLSMTTNSTASSTIIVTQNSSTETRALLPIDLTIANQTFANLIIKEK